MNTEVLKMADTYRRALIAGDAKAVAAYLVFNFDGPPPQCGQ